MDVEEHPAGPTVYVIGMAPDNPEGSNELPLTPVPDHVPPGSPVTKRFRFTTGSPEQTETGFHVDVADETTEIDCVTLFTQGAVPAV